MPKIFKVLCEGSSEYEYIQCINRTVRKICDDKEIEMEVMLLAENLGGSENAFKKRKKQEHETWIWLDSDVFKREPQKLEKRDKIKENLLLNTYNFEDFLHLHLEKKQTLQWQKICKKHNHFETPMVKNILDSAMQKSTIFSSYEKGKTPEKILENSVLKKEALKNLFDNHNDTEILFVSDIPNFLSIAFPSLIKELISQSI